MPAILTRHLESNDANRLMFSSLPLFVIKPKNRGNNVALSVQKMLKTRVFLMASCGNWNKNGMEGTFFFQRSQKVEDII